MQETTIQLYPPDAYQSSPIPWWHVNKNTAVFALGLQVATYPKSDGWKLTTYDAKHGGGIQLTAQNLYTYASRIQRILNGKKEPLRVELQGLGELDFNAGQGDLYADVWSAGEVTHRVVIATTLTGFYQKIKDALAIIDPNSEQGSLPDLEQIDISTGETLGNSSAGIIWEK